MGNNKDLYRNQKKRVISFCNFACTLTVVKMIYKPEKKFFPYQIAASYNWLKGTIWMFVPDCCVLSLCFSNNTPKKLHHLFFIHIYLSIFCCFYLYISYPLNQLLQYTSSWDVSCYSVVGWDWAKYVQPVKFGPLQPAVVSTVNDRKPCPVYFFFCVGFIFTFSFKIAVMWVLLSAADCA